MFSVELDTPLGMLRHTSVFGELSTTLAGELRHLDGIERLAENTPSSDNLRRLLDLALGDATKNMGIRQLIENLENARQYRKLLIRKDENG